MNSWLIALLFFLPAGVANSTPVVANKIPLLNRWNTPVDFGLSRRGKRLLGPNKRWRGVVTGSVVAGLTALVLYPLLPGTETSWHNFFIGTVLGLGALFGDSIESFIKRQRGIKPGKSWFPFDQLDYIAGGLLLVAPFYHLSLTMIAQVAVLFFGLHLLVAYLAYKLGLKSTPI